MKAVIVTAVLCVFFLSVGTVHGLYVPKQPQQLLEISDVILVGDIASKNTTTVTESLGTDPPQNYTSTTVEYTVNVEEFLKNTLDSNAVTIHSQESSSGGFEKGDRVVFYVDASDGKYTFYPESFDIPEYCDANQVIREPRIEGGNEFEIWQNGAKKKYNFTANAPIEFVYKKDMYSLYGEELEIFVHIAKKADNDTEVIAFRDTIRAESEPCEWIATAKWEITLDKGDYREYIEVRENGNQYITYQGKISVISDTAQDNTLLAETDQKFRTKDDVLRLKHDGRFLPPLNQEDLGVPYDLMRCNENLVLIQKYDGSPACVTEQTKQELIERGWANTAGIKKIENAMGTTQTQTDPIKETNCLPNQILYNNDCIHVLSITEDSPEGAQQYFVSSNHIITKHCTVDDAEMRQGEDHVSFDVCTKISSYTISQGKISNLDFGNEAKQQTGSDVQNAKQLLYTAYQEQVNLGHHYIRDVIVGLGTYEDTLVIDIPSKYTTHESISRIKKDVRHIVGDEVNIDYVVYDEPIESHIETVIPYLWNHILHQRGIEFTPKNQTYWNNSDGFADPDTVCSPLVAQNGTEFYISTTFYLEPFEITGTSIDQTKPSYCHKVWKTDAIMPEPDRVTLLWLENHKMD